MTLHCSLGLISQDNTVGDGAQNTKANAVAPTTSSTPVSNSTATTDSNSTATTSAPASASSVDNINNSTSSVNGSTTASNSNNGASNSTATTSSSDTTGSTATGTGSNSATTTSTNTGTASATGSNSTATGSSTGSATNSATTTAPANGVTGGSDKTGSTTSSGSTATNTGTGSTSGPNSGSTSTGTGTSGSSSSSGSGTTGSSGTGTGTGTASGSGTASTAPPISSPTKTAKVKVKVDETSIQGTGLVIGALKDSLPSVTPYLDSTKPEYQKFSNGAKKLHDKLKASALGDKITGTLAFKKIVAIDSQTVRAEYMTPIASGMTSDSVYSILNALDQQTVFSTTDLEFKVDFVPLPVKNRWHDGQLRLPSESYKSTLRDPDSTDFSKFKTTFETLLREELLRRVPVVRQVIIKEILQGSIIVPFAVETNENSTNTTTQSLSSALDTVTTIGDFSVDPNEDSKSMTDSEYISGMQNIDPIPKAQLPVLAIPTRDGEDIKSGTVSLAEKDKGPVRKDNYFLTVTLPAFIAILLAIILFLCCTATASRILNNNENAKTVP